ncbi:MAG: dihydrodipicolinate synthase family protein [Balneolales bacterium]
MEPIKGVIPPMVTPLLDADTIDRAGLENLIEHLIGGGVNGIFLLGTTGEAPSLNYSLKAELIKKTCEQVKGRVPILVGITDPSYRESANIAEISQKNGAQALVMAPPYYFNIGQDELYNHVDAFLDETPLPVFLYNMPALTKVGFGLEIVKELIKRPEVIGLKDSSADLTYFNKIKRVVKDDPNFSLLVGPEELLMETIVMGGDGGIPGGANVFPELYVSLYKKVKSGNIEKALSLHDEVMDLGSYVFGDVLYGSSDVINGIKCALKNLGVCNGYIAKPLKNVSVEKEKRIKSFISSYKAKYA